MRSAPGAAGAAGGSGPLRLTWVQPEDLLGHELRQADEDGRDSAGIRRRWLAAGGALAPARAGASTAAASPALRALAERLLDELALLPCPTAADEPTGLPEIVAACPDWPPPAPTGARDDGLVARLHAGWLGRAAGCLLGKPVEKLPLEGIRALARSTGNWPLRTWFTAVGLDPETAARHPWNRRSAGNSLAENIDGMPEDDDLNYPLLNLLLLERHGHAFTTHDVARLWLDELPAGRTFTAERIAYRNLLGGVEPPLTARHRNPFREWIGALIRADIHGLTHPGDPDAAARSAHRDAVLTHTANGVYGAMFVAAALAEAAAGRGDVHSCLRAGLRVVPPRSRLAGAVRHGIRLAADTADFDTVVDRLHDHHGSHHWVHVIPNAALLAAALTHADGDFTASVTRAVAGGWDTDSNGATAGSLAGVLAGRPENIPARWTEPLRNRLASSVRSFDGTGFDALAVRTAAVRARPAGSTGHTRTDATHPAEATEDTDLTDDTKVRSTP
nr:ADP-ribosylglycohydrolase family protein [Streptomyces sp. GC420]